MFFDDLLAGTYFGSNLAQYLMFLASVIAAVIASRVLYFLIKKYGTILTSKTETKFDDLVIEAMEKPMFFGGFIAGLFIGYMFLTPNIAFVTNNFSKAISALILIDIAWLSLKLVDGFIDSFLVPIADKTESKLDDQLIPILRKISKVGLIILFSIVLLSNFGVDILPLVAGLGIGGLAIAFAAQKTVEDVFGGISIFASKQFTVGDTVKISGVEGVVESVGIRNTRIRDLEGRVNTIPNSLVAHQVIMNISSEPARKVYQTLGLVYSTSHAKLVKALEILKEVVVNHPECRKDPMAVFKSYSSSSLDIWFVYYILNIERRNEVMSEVNLEVKKRFEKEGIEFAYPTQTLIIQSMPKIGK